MKKSRKIVGRMNEERKKKDVGKNNEVTLEKGRKRRKGMTKKTFKLGGKRCLDFPDEERRGKKD